MSDQSELGLNHPAWHDEVARAARHGRSQPIVITLAGEPIAKGRPRFTRAGIAFTPARTRQYETALKIVAGQAMAGRQPLVGPVRLYLEAYLPIPSSWSKKRQRAALDGTEHPTTRPDLDNLLKGASDALNGIVFRDDKQIIEAHLTKRYSATPRLVLTIASA